MENSLGKGSSSKALYCLRSRRRCVPKICLHTPPTRTPVIENNICHANWYVVARGSHLVFVYRPYRLPGLFVAEYTRFPTPKQNKTVYIWCGGTRLFRFDYRDHDTSWLILSQLFQLCFDERQYEWGTIMGGTYRHGGHGTALVFESGSQPLQ